MSELTVTRWARYGKERLYVTAADGDTVGYLDVHTGRCELALPQLAEEFEAALAGHLGSPPPPANPPGVAAATAPAVAALPAEPDPAWVDLAGNVAGQAAKEQAQAKSDALKARPLRTRLFDTDARKEKRNWQVGTKGEEAVGARLEKLIPRGWHVLHAVPVGTRGSDIDHVLIGPGGVYTINTKNHPGKKVWVSPHQVRVNGHKVEYLRNSRFEADRARKLLSATLGWEPPVKPALVLLTGTLVPDVTIKDGGPDDVLILDRTDVPGIFRKAPTRLLPDGIAAVFEVARRSSTWT